MKNKLIQKTLSLICALLLTFGSIAPALPVAAAEGSGQVITDLDTQTPDISEATPTEAQIVILYETPGDNNIADLGLTTKEVAAGNTLSDAVDLIVPEATVDDDALIDDINNNDNVLYAGYDAELETMALPNDAYLNAQDPTWFSLIGADKTWNLAGPNAVKVGVIDTGCDITHPDLVGRVTDVSDQYAIIKGTTAKTDMSGHGTAVSSVIAATVNNDIGVAGISGMADVTIYPYRTGGTSASSTGISAAAVAASLLDLVNNHPDIRLINMSLGVFDDGSTDAKNAIAILESPIAAAVAAGKILVASAGNTKSGQAGLYCYPAAFEGVISVGSVDKNGVIVSTSATNDDIDLTSTGDNLPLCALSGQYLVASGTSFSAPTVTGVCALLLSYNPNLTAGQIEAILETTALDRGEEGYDTSYGNGILQVDKALEKVIGAKGDVNGDHLVNASDALMILQAAVGLVTLDEDQTQRADVNVDGLINASDALMVLQFAVGIIDVF